MASYTKWSPAEQRAVARLAHSRESQNLGRGLPIDRYAALVRRLPHHDFTQPQPTASPSKSRHGGHAGGSPTTKGNRGPGSGSPTRSTSGGSFGFSGLGLVQPLALPSASPSSPSGFRAPGSPSRGQGQGQGQGQGHGHGQGRAGAGRPSVTGAPGVSPVGPGRALSPGRQSRRGPDFVPYAPVLSIPTLLAAIAANDDAAVKAAIVGRCVGDPMAYRQRSTGFTLMHQAVRARALRVLACLADLAHTAPLAASASALRSGRVHTLGLLCRLPTLSLAQARTLWDALSSEADPGAQDWFGDTALHEAARWSAVGLVDVLCRDVHRLAPGVIMALWTRNHKGRLPVEVAEVRPQCREGADTPLRAPLSCLPDIQPFSDHGGGW